MGHHLLHRQNQYQSHRLIFIQVIRITKIKNFQIVQESDHLIHKKLYELIIIFQFLILFINIS